MSNVTAALECLGCEEILEAEERPNINWKLGTTRIVLVPARSAIEHVIQCPGLQDSISAALAALGIADLDSWQKRFLAAPSIRIKTQDSTPEGLELVGQASIQGTEVGLVIIEELSINGTDLGVEGTTTLQGLSPDVVTLDETGGFKVTLPATAGTAPADESTEKKSTPEPDEKPAAKKRSTK